MDAVVALSEYGRGACARRGLAPERVRVIPHGAFDHLTRVPRRGAAPAGAGGGRGPVVLCFGLIRPYKGVDVLVEAFREIEGAELWVVGRPLGMSIGDLREQAGGIGATVRFVDRFVADTELAAYFRRADIVALPYRDAEQSGVLFTALAFGKAIVLTDVGGFGEMAGPASAKLVPPNDPAALAAALAGLLADPDARAAGRRPRAAAAGPYSWDAIAAQTLDLYRGLDPGDGRSRSSSGSRAGLLVYTMLGYPLVLLWLSRRARGAAPPRSPTAAGGLADRRRARRGGEHRRLGALDARDRLPARAARGDRRLRRLHRPHRRAGVEGGRRRRRSRCPEAARSRR